MLYLLFSLVNQLLKNNKKSLDYWLSSKIFGMQYTSPGHIKTLIGNISIIISATALKKYIFGSTFKGEATDLCC